MTVTGLDIQIRRPLVGGFDKEGEDEQVMYVIEGACDFTVDGETRRVGPGGVVVIPPHAVHSSQPLKACRVLDVFHPVREDYR